MHDFIQPLLAQYGLIIILAAIALDSFGIPAPGQSLLVAGALLSAHGEFDIRLFLISSALAALAGSLLGYLVGRLGGRKLLLRLPLNVYRIEKMEALCQRYGALFVVLSRFIDGPRQLAGIFVGSLKMPAITFFPATAFGAVLWVGVWGLGSYYFGQHAHVIAEKFDNIAAYTWIVTGLLILALCVYLFRRRGHRNLPSGTR